MAGRGQWLGLNVVVLVWPPIITSPSSRFVACPISTVVLVAAGGRAHREGRALRRRLNDIWGLSSPRVSGWWGIARVPATTLTPLFHVVPVISGVGNGRPGRLRGVVRVARGAGRRHFPSLLYVSVIGAFRQQGGVERP